MSRKLHLITIVCVLSNLAMLNAADAPQNATAFWKTSSGTASDEDIVIADLVSGNDLVMTPGTGAKIVDDNAAPDHKALVFDGTQIGTMRAKKKVDLRDGFYATMQIKPEDEGADSQSIMYFFTVAELRLSRESKNLVFVVWIAPQKTYEVRVPAKMGDWNNVSISVQGRTAEITVDGTTTPIALPPDVNLNLVESSLSVGNATERPYSGAIANISLATSKPN